MHFFVERGMRGGISMVSKRYAKANNPLVQDYDPSKPNKYIMYLDANNLYGWAMSKPLPKRDFKWKRVMPTEEDIIKKKENAKNGWILEVDLEYPAELHEQHNSYPLAPEKKVVKKECMSDYQKRLMKDLELKPPDSEKLLLRLEDKSNYVVHYRNLQMYLKQGMKLKRVHRVLEFEQECWMEPYIRMNTEFRKNAKSDFEKNFYKLMNNSVFGKTMENLRNRVDIKNSEKQWDRQNKEIGCKPFVLKACFVFKQPGRNRHAHKPAAAQQAGLHGDDYPWQQQDPDVRLFLQQTKKAIRPKVRALVHRHRQPSAWDWNGWRLQRHRNKQKSIWYERLPEGASTLLKSQQKGLGQNERRMCRNPHSRVCVSETENVLYLEGRRKKYQKSKGCKKECCQETNNAWTVQGNAFWYGAFFEAKGMRSMAYI